MDDLSFLALLVHRGLLRRDEAEALAPRLSAGGSLDRLLEEDLGWERPHVRKLRRTRAGLIPEIPGYEIAECVGAGGTAQVFRARETRTGRRLALKVLTAEAARDDGVRKAFVQEARLLERLRHPGLVEGYGIARSGSTYFSRLAFVDGSTLLELLDGGRRFGEDEALAILLAVAEVLAFLEGEGLVHRDVKPGNVMLTRTGRVVLIDLGFTAREAACAPPDACVGTVQYLSPEQARGGAAADCRSDIYSLGISLFHLVVGRLPFEADDDREVLRMQVMDSLQAPELRGRAISPHLQYFIEKMVAKDAADRYQSFAQLIDDVRGHLAGRADLDFTRNGPGASSEPFKRRP